jgi:hypothetical protein
MDGLSPDAACDQITTKFRCVVVCDSLGADEHNCAA